MTNKEALLKYGYLDPNFGFALRNASKEELEEALYECTMCRDESKQKIGRIRAAIKRRKTRALRANQ